MCVLVPGGAAVAPPFRRVATRADKYFDTIALMCSAIIDTDTHTKAEFLSLHTYNVVLEVSWGR